MRSDDLKQMVGRECEFLSYYLEEYQRELKNNPQDKATKEMVIKLQAKWEAYDKVYRYIKKIFPKT